MCILYVYYNIIEYMHKIHVPARIRCRAGQPFRRTCKRILCTYQIIYHISCIIVLSGFCEIYNVSWLYKNTVYIPDHVSYIIYL